MYLDLVTFYTDFLIYYYLKSAASKWFKKLAHFVFRQIKHHYNESEINCLVKKVLTRYKLTYGFTREDIRAIIKIQDELLSETSLT